MFSSYGYGGGANGESPKVLLRDGHLNARRISFLISNWGLQNWVFEVFFCKSLWKLHYFTMDRNLCLLICQFCWDIKNRNRNSLVGCTEFEK